MTQDLYFDKVERKIYPRTFLSGVFVVFTYGAIEEPEDLIPRIRLFVRDNFNLQIDVTDREFRDGFSIDSKEGGHSFYFRQGYIGVKYMKSDYVSFTVTMLPLVYRLFSFVKNVLSVSSLESAIIRKVNILNVQEKEGETLKSCTKLEQDIISRELIDLAEPVEEYLGLDNAKELKGTTDGDNFEIHYGFQRGLFPDGHKYVGLVLDESITRTQISLNDADDTLKEVNDKMFNMFHWSVSSSMLAIMSQEK